MKIIMTNEVEAYHCWREDGGSPDNLYAVRAFLEGFFGRWWALTHGDGVAAELRCEWPEIRNPDGGERLWFVFIRDAAGAWRLSGPFWVDVPEQRDFLAGLCAVAAAVAPTMPAALVPAPCAACPPSCPVRAALAQAEDAAYRATVAPTVDDPFAAARATGDLIAAVRWMADALAAPAPEPPGADERDERIARMRDDLQLIVDEFEHRGGGPETCGGYPTCIVCVAEHAIEWDEAAEAVGTDRAIPCTTTRPAPEPAGDEPQTERTDR